MQTNYHSLSQQELRTLHQTTGSLLLLDIPEGLEFGIDNILWQIGQKFKGIKFIPFGAHIISYTLKNENNLFKINKFLYFDQSKNLQTQIIVLKWSFKYSLFLELKGSEAQGYREGVRNFHFDSYLGPYPLQNLQFWRDNSSYITRGVLQKLDPVEKIYKFQEEYSKIKESEKEEVRIDIDEDDDVQIIEEENNNEEEIQEPTNKEQPEDQPLNQQEHPNKKKEPTHNTKKFEALTDTIYYTQIPRVLVNDPSHINKVNLNKTQILIQIISKEWLKQNQPTNKFTITTDDKPSLQSKQDPRIFGLLGEVQYSFVYFLIGQDEESFQQWKKLINLLTFSEDIFENKQILALKKDQLSKGNKLTCKLIDSFQQIALEFIVVLYNQLKQFPVDFFVDELSKDNFMEGCLKRLNEYKQDSDGVVSKKVKKRLQKLLKLLSTKFNYEFNHEDQLYDEDAPTLVETDPNYF